MSMLADTNHRPRSRPILGRRPTATRPRASAQHSSIVIVYTTHNAAASSLFFITRMAACGSPSGAGMSMFSA